MYRGFVEIVKSVKLVFLEVRKKSHRARGTTNLLFRLGIFGIIVVEAKFNYAWYGKAKGNNGFADALLHGVVHVVGV